MKILRASYGVNLVKDLPTYDLSRLGGFMTEREYEKMLASNWIDKVLEVNFMDKDIILEQVRCAEMSISLDCSLAFLNFEIRCNVPLYPHKECVPIDMVAYQKDAAPIVFLLVVKNGLLHEIEVSIADLSKIDIYGIELSKVEYQVNFPTLEN